MRRTKQLQPEVDGRGVRDEPNQASSRGRSNSAQAQLAAATRARRATEVAQVGVRGAAAELPHQQTIQSAFGSHDIGGVKAAVGDQAAAASDTLGASAYAFGDRVGFAQTPDLHTAAHEAAHVVQQRRGVVPESGLGSAGDSHEQHADRIADLVVGGQSAEHELDKLGGGARSEAVQRKETDSASAIESLPTETSEQEPASASGGATRSSRDGDSIWVERLWGFDVNSAALTGSHATAIDQLTVDADAHVASRDDLDGWKVVRTRGYASPDGELEHNQGLSLQRAQSVAAHYLDAAAIDGVGELESAGATPADYPYHRAVEVDVAFYGSSCSLEDNQITEISEQWFELLRRRTVLAKTLLAARDARAERGEFFEGLDNGAFILNLTHGSNSMTQNSTQAIVDKGTEGGCDELSGEKNPLKIIENGAECIAKSVAMLPVLFVSIIGTSFAGTVRDSIYLFVDGIWEGSLTSEYLSDDEMAAVLADYEQVEGEFESVGQSLLGETDRMSASKCMTKEEIEAAIMAGAGQ